MFRVILEEPHHPQEANTSRLGAYWVSMLPFVLAVRDAKLNEMLIQLPLRTWCF